tara:strand:- start:40 stop:429 length:390 start_codon:yes stop_codon:yes gene_type:complete
MATKKVFKTKSKWDIPSAVAETTYGEVKTKPNQSMSIRDILFRNTAGMTYDNYKTPYYEEQATFSSESLNKIQEMEPVEKLQYLQEVSTKVNNLKTKIQDFETQKAEALEKQRLDALQENQEEVISGTE